MACSEDAHSSRHTERSGNARRYRASREGFVGLLRRSAHRMALGPGANCRVRPQATNLCSRARERSRRLLSLSVPPARAELSICGSILCTCGRAPGSCCLRMRCGTLDTWASPPWKLIPIQMLNRSTLLVARFALASKLHPSPGSRIEHVHSCVSQRVQPCKLTRLRWAFEQRLESWIARLSVAIGRVKFCLAGGHKKMSVNTAHRCPATQPPPRCRESQAAPVRACCEEKVDERDRCHHASLGDPERHVLARGLLDAANAVRLVPEAFMA